MQAYLQSVVDMVEALAWPVLIGASIFYFRTDIKALVPRIRQFGMAGITVDSFNASQAQIAAPTSNPSSSSAFSEFVPTDLLNESRENIKKALKDAGHDSADAAICLDAAATVNVLLIHERNYRLIFGSQIILLKRANEHPNFSLESARSVYDEAANAFPEAYQQIPIGFDAWLAFLVSGGLLHRDNDILRIGSRGRGLLRYMIENGLPEKKPF